MKLVAHIGTPKTGTTSIQNFLDENRVNLVERGYYYLQSMGRRSHEAFPRCCFGEERLRDDYFLKKGIMTPEGLLEHKKEKLQDLHAELESLPEHVHTVITSCEHFYSRLKSIDEIERFQEIVTKYFNEVRIVVYLREQADLVVSLYSTNLKSGGGTKSLIDFVRSHCVKDNDYYNYFHSLDRWGRVFGRENIVVRLFDRSEFVNGDLIEDFIAQSMPVLQGKLNTKVSYSNESLDHVGQVLARYVNEKFPKFHKKKGVNPINQLLIDILSERFKGKGESLPEGEISRISDDFDASNERLCKEYFPERQRLFKRLVKEKEGLGRILNEEQEQGLREFLDLFIEKLKKPLSAAEVDVIRDSALALEETDIVKAYELMRVAAYLKPNGRLISRKLSIYRDMLDPSEG